MSSTTTATSGQEIEPGHFQCGTCKRRYKRVDHLARHVRSHTKTKPYQCHVCPKAFGRADLLKRHVLAHGSSSTRGRRSTSPNTSTAHPARVTQACQACAMNHLRCKEEKPCQRCLEKGIDCVWDRLNNMAITPPGTEVEMLDGTNRSVSPNGLFEAYETTVYSPMEADRHTLAQTSHIDPQLQPSPDIPDLTLLSGQWTPMGALDFDTSMSIELNDVDLRFLEAYNMNVPFEQDFSSQQSRADDFPAGDSADPVRSAAACTETFRNHWRFRPSAQDNGSAEEHNLSLPPIGQDHASPESKIPLGRRVTCAKLSVSSRDKILASIVQSLHFGNLARAVESFPSVELLDTLLQYYLASPVARSACFLHTSTFDPNKKRPELLAAMVAGGAVMTADPALSKLGLAIQECLRAAIPLQFERNNTTTRDLELSQAFLIVLEIGLWSGHSRKVEIAESFLQPHLTMLRRDGKLRRSRYAKVPVPDEDTDPDSLGLAWLKWVEQESMKRLTFRVLEHDTNASIALLINPLISYAEVQLPMPDSASLWSAATPEQWRALLPTANSTLDRPLSLADYMDNPAALTAHRSVVDTGVASLAFLSCTWRLAWEHIQLSTLQRATTTTTGASRGRPWNALVMSSRHDGISQLLENLRISMDYPREQQQQQQPEEQQQQQQLPHSEELVMRLELNLMHLHTPLEEIQLFAGMEGPEQAHMVYPRIREWAKSEAARSAVWHAGQILRAAKRLPKSTIGGPCAIMVYHASLVLWVYGLLSYNTEGHPHGELSASRAPISSNAAAEGQSSHTAVWLDGPEGVTTQRFVQLATGRPCIRGFPQSDDRHDVCLSQPDRAIAVVASILRRNHEGLSRSRLVDNLLQLLEGLQKACTKTGGFPSMGL